MDTFKEQVTLEGHIIDTWLLHKALNTIVDLGGQFEVEDIRIGQRKTDGSFARLKVSGATNDILDQILVSLEELGAVVASRCDVETQPAPADGLLPEDFYATTHMPTQVRLHGRWIDVADTEMDLAIVVDSERSTARMLPMAEVRQGDAVVVGHRGVREFPPQRVCHRDVFTFMASEVSSERPKRQLIEGLARLLWDTRAGGGRILVVAGPAVVHSGAGPYLERMIRGGFVQVLFGGNALAAHDAECALFGTSLGIRLSDGEAMKEGHRYHLAAINQVRCAGSLRAAVSTGLLKRGIMYEAIKKEVDVVLAGSIRDDGPIPGVVHDMTEAQRRMRAAVRGVEVALMVATMLHSIATGNLLPVEVKVVAVDINPAVVTKLADRGTFQAMGLVTDAELFLRELADALGV